MSNVKPRARFGVVFFPPLPRPPTCLLGSFISGLVRMNQSSGVGIVGFVCLWCSGQCLCDCGVWWHQCNIEHTLRLLKMPSTSSRIHGNKSNHMYLMLSIAVLVANSWCNRYQISMSRPYVQAKWQLYRHMYVCSSCDNVSILSRMLLFVCEQLCGPVYEGCFLMMFLSRRMTLQRMWKKNLRRSFFFIPFW